MFCFLRFTHMKYLKALLVTILCLLAIIGTLSISNLWQKWTNPKTVVSATVLLERIEKVVKLTTVEGNFSEIYNYKNHIVADIWPLRKKAIVRINAKVAVGYNFNDLNIDINNESHIITIQNFPEAEILSIEHDMNYYNFENGLFNMITNKDITEMGIKAKQFIADKAIESDLFNRAEEQKIELFDMLGLAMGASGWKLIYPDSLLLK
ncbi:MAG: hypothetical protein ACJA01_003453 [Saprospiraceae bacterium]|jgi:hypothetical protein